MGGIDKGGIGYVNCVEFREQINAVATSIGARPLIIVGGRVRFETVRVRMQACNWTRNWILIIDVMAIICIRIHIGRPGEVRGCRAFALH